MPKVTNKQRHQARLHLRDTRAYELLAIRLAARVGLRVQRRALQGYKRQEQDWAKHALDVFTEVKPVLVDAVMLAYFRGLIRGNLSGGKTLALARGFSALDRAVDAAAARLKVSNRVVSALARLADAQAIKVLDGVRGAVEKKLEAAVVEITRQNLHVDAGVNLLRKAFFASGIKPTNSFQLEAIFRTQTQLAYQAGRWQANQEPEIQEILWGYKYVTVGDDRVRPSHQLLEGVTLPKDHPFWLTNWPPNGWACRCQAIEIFDEVDVVEPPDVTEIDGEWVVPGADEGFGYNAGELFRAFLV